MQGHVVRAFAQYGPCNLVALCRQTVPESKQVCAPTKNQEVLHVGYDKHATGGMREGALRAN